MTLYFGFLAWITAVSFGAVIFVRDFRCQPKCRQRRIALHIPFDIGILPATVDEVRRRAWLPVARVRSIDMPTIAVSIVQPGAAPVLSSEVGRKLVRRSLRESLPQIIEEGRHASAQQPARRVERPQ